MSFQFREHRGGLHESMQTLVTLESREHLVVHCMLLLRPYLFLFTRDELSIRLYDENPDHRIGWEQTYVVNIERYGVMGFTDKDPNKFTTEENGTDKQESQPPS